MKLQDNPETELEQTIVDAILDTLNEIDPNNSIYPQDQIYFNTSDTDGNELALLKFEKFPSMPATEFGRGKSSMQMKEDFEAELMDTLPDNIKLERKTRLIFSFYEQ